MNWVKNKKPNYQLFLVVISAILMLSCSTTRITWQPLYEDRGQNNQPSIEQKRAARASAQNYYREAETTPKESSKEMKSKQVTQESFDPKVYSDQIRTRDGKSYQCRIVKQDEKNVYMTYPGGNFSIPRDMIVRIGKVGEEEPGTTIEITE